MHSIYDAFLELMLEAVTYMYMHVSSNCCLQVNVMLYVQLPSYTQSLCQVT
jgi:hypothetical protein